MKTTVKKILLKLGFVSFRVISPNASGRYLLAHNNVFVQRPDLIVAIERHKNCGSISVRYSILRDAIPPERASIQELCIWTNNQLLSKYAQKEIDAPLVTYFQHGDFSFNSPEILEELSALKPGSTFYIWHERDANIFSNLNPRITISPIGFDPSANDRAKVGGHGFATRGPEYLRSDIAIIKRHPFPAGETITVYFHPAYNHYQQLVFLCLTFILKRRRLRLGAKTEITKILITESKSMKRYTEC